MELSNRVYRNTDNRLALRSAFGKSSSLPSITLHKFWNKKVYLKLRQQIIHLSFTKEINLTTHSFGRARVPAALLTMLNQTEIRTLISEVTSTKITPVTWTAYRFSWKDYTILHDHLQESARMEFVFDFTENWPEQAGGAIVYKRGSDDNFLISPQGNSLSIVQSGARVQKFIQYVNHYGKGKQRILVMGSIKLK